MPKANPEQERISRLADAALAYAKDYKAPHHIYKALDQEGIKDVEARAAYIPMIKKELHRRKKAEEPETPLSERQDLIEDARIQELRHPREDDDEAD